MAASKNAKAKAANITSLDCKCTRNTLILLIMILGAFIVFVIIGIYCAYNHDNDNARPNDISNSLESIIRDLEYFQETVDNKATIENNYSSVFNGSTVQALSDKVSKINKIKDSNDVEINNALDQLQANISILVKQMNTNLYRQLQHNYRVANDIAIERSATDLTNLPLKGF